MTPQHPTKEIAIWGSTRKVLDKNRMQMLGARGIDSNSLLGRDTLADAATKFIIVAVSLFRPRLFLFCGRVHLTGGLLEGKTAAHHLEGKLDMGHVNGKKRRYLPMLVHLQSIPGCNQWQSPHSGHHPSDCRDGSMPPHETSATCYHQLGWPGDHGHCRNPHCCGC